MNLQSLEFQDSPFEARDLTSSFSVEVHQKLRAAGKPTYTGVERRYHSRRQLRDRRSEVRFEIDKPDRRKNFGRRRDDGVDITR